MSAVEFGWEVDPPEGQCWACPDCSSWATLPGNAGFHQSQTGHGTPVLKPVPKAEEPTELAAVIAASNELEAALAEVGLPREAGVAGLIRHHRNNAAAAMGGFKLAADTWQERAEAAERVLVDAVAVINGLAEQQAMPDDWYVARLAAIEKVVGGERPGLQATIVGYLESKGWYFDWDHINEVWEEDSPTSLNKRPDAIRTLHGWTVPQWGEYWSKPYSDDPKHKNFGAPKTRRYEKLDEAIMSQLLREEEPEKYEMFFKVRGES